MRYFLKYTPYIFRKSRVIQLTFFVTRRCNSKCSFCFYLSQEPEVHEKELSLEEIERFSSSMGELLWLLFSGGEVFLRDDIVEIAKVFYRNNRPAILTLPTNALLPELIYERTREIVKSCPESVVVLKLSLDGIGGEHDAIRGVRGNFEKVMETYSLVKELLRYPNFELGVNTVFCSANQDSIMEVLRFVEREMPEIRTHTVSLVRGNPRDTGMKQVDLEKYRETISFLERKLDSRHGSYSFAGSRLKTAQDILQRRLIYETARQNRRLIPCYAGRLNLVVTENGDVYPCEILSEKLGNLRESGYSIPRILESERAKRVIGDIASGKCHCTHECYFVTNILFNPAMYPKLLGEYIKLFRKKKSNGSRE